MFWCNTIAQDWPQTKMQETASCVYYHLLRWREWRLWSEEWGGERCQATPPEPAQLQSLPQTQSFLLPATRSPLLPPTQSSLVYVVELKQHKISNQVMNEGVIKPARMNRAQQTRSWWWSSVMNYNVNISEVEYPGHVETVTPGWGDILLIERMVF